MTIFTTGYYPNLLSYADTSNKKMAETNQIVQILAVLGEYTLLFEVGHQLFLLEDQIQTHEHLVCGEDHFLSAAFYQ